MYEAKKIFNEYAGQENVLGFKNLNDKKATIISLFGILEDIGSEVHKNSVGAVRKILETEGKDRYDEARKNKIPCFIVGLSKIGADKSKYDIENATCFLALDIDDKKEDQEKNRKILTTLPFIISVFTSVGGSGLCAIVKIDPKKRSESIKAAKLILKKLGVTVAEGQDNPNRLRYVSYDPNIYINPNLNSITCVPIEETDYNVAFKKMVEYKSQGKKIWKEGERHIHLISVLTWANKAGIPGEDCLELCEKYIRPLMENGTGFNINEQVYHVYNQYKKEFNTKPWDYRLNDYYIFWDVDDNGKITIHRTRLIELLSKNGFSIYYLDASKKAVTIIRTIDNLVEEITSVIVAQFINAYILSLPEDLEGISKYALRESFFRGIDTYLSKNLLNLLPATTIDFLRDTKECAFFAFKNGVVKVAKQEICKLIPYNELGKKIWKNQVIDFEVKLNLKYDFIDGGEYSKFNLNIAGGNLERLKYQMKVAGYLLHRYKDPSRPFAIILAEEAESDENGGGTGKGLFIKSISKLRRVVIMDGQSDKADKSFRLQRVSLDTDIICIEDCKKGLDFSNYYPWITEGITVEKKNQQEIFIPFEESPKIALTTNYTIANLANHAKRRQRVLEFSNHYSPKNTPEDEFGHLLFSDWDNNEWQQFYNFNFLCVGIYLNEGIDEIDNSVSIRRKQIKELFSEEFLEWWDGYTANGRAEWKMSTEMYYNFLRSQQVEKKNFSQKKFKKGMESASRLFGLKFESQLNRNRGNRSEYRCVEDVSHLN